MTASNSQVFEFLFFLCLVFVDVETQIQRDYCVVGAGPSGIFLVLAGLQMGFFLQKAGRDYIIFERNNVAGSFYVKFPRHRKLISINKRHTGKTNKEFNLRHDWNSLISDDESLLMKYYSKEFFPHADHYVRYLNDYAKKLELKIQYNTNIKNITRQSDGLFSLKDNNGTKYTCKDLIMSTGIATENLGDKFKGVEYTEKYSEISTNPDDYEGQTVLIIGRGNSAFETADSIMGATNLIHMISRSRVRLAWETHYVGDLRAINNGILDTYQLKSLDALLEAPLEELAVIKKDNKLYVDAFEGDGKHAVTSTKIVKNSDQPDNFAIREPYDRIIRCLGFQFDFSIFDNSTNPGRCKGFRRKKYPSISPSYESLTVPHLYFAGTNTHSIDLRKSAGGFIHGFRYTTRALHHLLEWKSQGVVWPHVVVPYIDLMNIILKRINEASGMYQMFSVLGDVIIIRDDGQVAYFEEFPVKLVDKFQEHTGYPTGPMIVLNLEYGKGFSGAGKDTFKPNRATGEPSEAHMSNFLHPVFYFYQKQPTAMVANGEDISLPRPDRIHHVVEDFITTWMAPESHIVPLRRFLEYIKHQDLRHFFAKSCFEVSCHVNLSFINDIFRDGRATGDAVAAHMSNFLHPVIYFYRRPLTKMAVLGKDVSLPHPDRIHHIVEDFLTAWEHWDHQGTIGTIKGPLGPSRDHWDHQGIIGTIKGPLGPSRDHWDHQGTIGTIKGSLGPSRDHWDLQVTIGTIKGPLGPSRDHWDLQGTIGTIKGPLGPSRDHCISSSLNSCFVNNSLFIIKNDTMFLRTAPGSHILLLRRFLEYIKHQDLRHFFSKSCFE
ncbi:hypothetical protein QZH41_014001, partial [Actinostola sp. cb2023]